VDIALTKPEPQGRDLLVQIHSLSWPEAAAFAAHRNHRLGDAVRPTRHTQTGAGRCAGDIDSRRAGGVGSISIQLARRLTPLTVVATASRAETREWAERLGAHHVIDHSRPLAAQVIELDIGLPGFVFSTTNTDSHFGEIAELIAPQGRFGLIDDPPPVDIGVFKRKSVSLHWESMFTRSSFATPDVAEQGALLNQVAKLADDGVLQTTLAADFGTINAENLKRAHAVIESGRSKGKIILQGFGPNP